MTDQKDTGGTVLVVDDEPDLRASVSEYFSINGFSVFEAGNGDDMRAVMARTSVDVVLMDLRLPGEDGFALCRELRQGPPVGIIMLTGSTDVVDKVVGLEMGADDYVSKPFELRELLARVRGVRRRVVARPAAVPSYTPPGAAETRSLGRFTLNMTTQTLHDGDGQPLPLTGMEFDLLRVFTDNPDRVLSRDQLLDAAHHKDWEPFDRSIDIRIMRLRKKIEREPARPRLLRTVRGAGYMFCPDGDAP